MARLPFLFAFAGAALLGASPAAAVPSVSDSGADAIVLKPLTLLKTEDMDFGGLLASGAAGTAVLNPFTGAVTATGGVTAVNGPTAAAAFIGAGTRRAPVIIRIPKNPITLTRSGGTETMTVSTWTLDGASTRLINAFEAFEFQVGGTLTVGANQAPGTYVGTFSVEVQYP